MEERYIFEEMSDKLEQLMHQLETNDVTLGKFKQLKTEIIETSVNLIDIARFDYGVSEDDVKQEIRDTFCICYPRAAPILYATTLKMDS